MIFFDDVRKVIGQPPTAEALVIHSASMLALTAAGVALLCLAATEIREGRTRLELVGIVGGVILGLLGLWLLGVEYAGEVRRFVWWWGKT